MHPRVSPRPRVCTPSLSLVAFSRGEVFPRNSDPVSFHPSRGEDDERPRLAYILVRVMDRTVGLLTCGISHCHPSRMSERERERARRINP